MLRKAFELATFAKVHKSRTMKVFQHAGIGLVLLFFLSACQSETAESESGVKAVPLDQSFSNADLIRNPVTARTPEAPDAVAVIEFEETRFDFGEVFEGDVVEHAFSFANTGTVPLLISDARATCGCTVPEWPDRPIAPGERGTIRVRFDTVNKESRQSKPITITANTYPAQTRIYLDGVVLPRGKPGT